MSSYPDNIEDLGQPGPSHSTLRVQYHEEHGVMPGPELNRELVDNYWQGVPPKQEGNGQFSTDNIDPILLEQQQQQHGGVVEMSHGGYDKLIQRRLDLAPFMDSAPHEIYAGAYAAPQPGFGHGHVLDQSVFPVAHNQPSEPFDFAPVEPTYAAAFVGGAPPIQEYGVPYAGGAAPINEYGGPYVGGTASVNGYGVPSVGGAAPSNGYDIAPVEVAAPVHDHGIAPVGLAVPIPEIGAHAMIELPIPAQNDPFVTSIANSAPESSTASSSASNPAGSAPADPIPAASSAPTSAPQQAPRKSKSKSRWTEAELARLVYLKEEKNYEWVDILRDLGAHTRKSIPDKYYELCRKRRGLKK